MLPWGGTVSKIYMLSGLCWLLFFFVNLNSNEIWAGLCLYSVLLFTINKVYHLHHLKHRFKVKKGFFIPWQAGFVTKEHFCYLISCFSVSEGPCVRSNLFNFLFKIYTERLKFFSREKAFRSLLELLKNNCFSVFYKQIKHMFLFHSPASHQSCKM